MRKGRECGTSDDLLLPFVVVKWVRWWRGMVVEEKEGRNRGWGGRLRCAGLDPRRQTKDREDMR